MDDKRSGADTTEQPKDTQNAEMEAIEKILPMLSWHNPPEVQREGVIRGQESLPMEWLFQPVLKGCSKELWENCAQILLQKSDQELEPWLLQCYLWLQDINWPGAETVLARLRRYENQAQLADARNRAAAMAAAIGDAEWLSWIEESAC